MTGVENRLPVVAGIDGSRAALHAVRWAATEAARRDRPLLLLHVSPLPSRRPRDRGEARVARGDAWFEAAHVARGTAPRVPVRTALRVGSAAEELVRASGAAELVVLGSRGLGGLAGVLLGSVAATVAAHARCPVIIVRGLTPEEGAGHDTAAPPAGGPVVVGVDGSPDSDAAVGFAFDAAANRGVPLIAVHAEHRTPATSAPTLPAEWLASWSAKYPHVELRQSLVSARPRPALLDAASRAQLIVVGARGRSAVAGVPLGLHSQALLRHSECPVAVVHAQERAGT